jgi:nicotinate-nucleotide adenylyltransferase
MTPGRSERIGVMGGAFDPPHLAHQALATLACQQLQLDRLLVIPTGQAWHKPRALTDAQHRLAMCRLAFDQAASVSVDERELHRPGPSYTIDTLRELAVLAPGCRLFLIIGADQAIALTHWRAWQEIIGSATICVADRASSVGANPLFDAETASATRFLRLVMPSLPISATEIRAKLADKQDISMLVSSAVARYIADHHLYQTL